MLLLYVIAAIGLIIEGGMVPARAAEDPGDLLNYSFAVWLGSGMTIGARESVSIWKIELDRVGIDYSWGDAGLRGIGFNMGFPF